MKRAVVVSNRNGTMNRHAGAMAKGLLRHGFSVEIVAKGSAIDADWVVCWGWREGRRLRAEGKNVLVMERGYLSSASAWTAPSDRFEWTSLGWNGLNGRAAWNPPADGGERFEKYFRHKVYAWDKSDGYALVIGQVRGDASLANVNADEWYDRAIAMMRLRGFDVYYRPHPDSVKRGHSLPVDKSYLLGGTLDAAFAGAACVVTYNSNTGVDAALFGVPVIACDEGAMAWPVAAHGLDADLVTPDREAWFRDMSWRQWLIEEIESGLAWEHVSFGLEMPLAA